MLLSGEKHAQHRLLSSFQVDVGFIIAVKTKIEVALAKRIDSSAVARMKSLVAPKADYQINNKRICARMHSY